MKKEYDEYLTTTYPKIFRDRRGDKRETLMCWGFEHGDGWFAILDNMCALIQDHIDGSRRQRAQALWFNRQLKRALAGDPSGLEKYFAVDGVITAHTKMLTENAKAQGGRTVYDACPQVVAIQVKEKFGSLRFYYNHGDDFVEGVISMAAKMSEVTCDVCGAPGKRSGKGWIVTRCAEH